MGARYPEFRWDADAWLSDEKLRACSLGARGLWADMLSLMHKNDRRGYLQINGLPVTPEQFARMTGCLPDEATRYLAELLNSGVASVTETGIVYSRRMIRDERKRSLCSVAGKNGGGNPTFKGHPKGHPKGAAKVPADDEKTVHSVCVSSLKEKKEIKHTHQKDGGPGEGNGFVEFFAAFPRRTARAAAVKAWKKINPDADLIASIMAAVKNQMNSDQWKRGVYPHPATWLNGRRWEDEMSATTVIPDDDAGLRETAARLKAAQDRDAEIARERSEHPERFTIGSKP